MSAHSEPLLRVQGLSQRYRLPRSSLWRPAVQVQALHDVSFSLRRGASLGVVGESGSGKSTLARLVMALEQPSAGQVFLDGEDLHALDAASLRQRRSRFQMVFQDPYGSLDPRRRIGLTVGEPLDLLPQANRSGRSGHSSKLDSSEQAERVAQALESVGLNASDAQKYPHEFSGGQRQRIALARALITRPALIVADEPVSALDVSVQAQVLNLMQDLQDQLGLSYLFISHDLSVIDLVCDELIVLHNGRVVEAGSADEVFRQPQHPYTQRLLQAVPGRTHGNWQRAPR